MVLGPGDDPLVLGSFSAWSVWILGLFGTLIGSIIFAVATIRAGVFSRRAAIALAVSSATVLLFMFGLIGTNAQGTLMEVLLRSSWVRSPRAGSRSGSWRSEGARSAPSHQREQTPSGLPDRVNARR